MSHRYKTWSLSMLASFVVESGFEYLKVHFMVYAIRIWHESHSSSVYNVDAISSATMQDFLNMNLPKVKIPFSHCNGLKAKNGFVEPSSDSFDADSLIHVATLVMSSACFSASRNPNAR